MIKYPNVTPLMGGGGYKGNTFLATKYLFLIDPDEVIASVSTLALEGTYTTLIAAEKLIPLGEVFSLERTDVEAKFDQGLSGESVKANPELKAFKAHFNWNEDQAKQSFLIEGRDWRLIIGDASGNLKVEKFGTSFRGFELLSCHVNRKEGSESTIGVTTVFFQLADTESVEQNAFIQPVNFPLSGLKALTSVTLSSGAVTTNSGVATVQYISPSYGLADGTKRTAVVLGVVAANFAIYSSAGVARASVTATPVATNPGQYTVGATGYVATDTIQVVPSSTNLYKSNIVTVA
jgi:hypothetical protein